MAENCFMQISCRFSFHLNFKSRLSRLLNHVEALQYGKSDFYWSSQDLKGLKRLGNTVE